MESGGEGQCVQRGKSQTGHGGLKALKQLCMCVEHGWAAAPL